MQLVISGTCTLEAKKEKKKKKKKVFSFKISHFKGLYRNVKCMPTFPFHLGKCLGASVYYSSKCIGNGLLILWSPPLIITCEKCVELWWKSKMRTAHPFIICFFFLSIFYYYYHLKDILKKFDFWSIAMTFEKIIIKNKYF